MTRILSTLFFLLLLNHGQSQNFTGQWKGEFVDKSTSFVGWGGDHCEYVLELECSGKTVSGYSYTYFNEGGKRYYTICRLEGSVDMQAKSVRVREVERTKTNVPQNIRNCFQIHTLYFHKEDNEEVLDGTWQPAPNQEGDCGYGKTVLTRRLLTKVAPKFNNATARNTPSSNKKLPDLKDKNKTTTPVVTKKPVVISPPITKNTAAEKLKVEPIVTAPATNNKPIEDKQSVVVDNSYEKRNSSLIKTIELENESFKVDLYDNGDIDGDSISLFYNNKLILSHKRLSDKAISLTLSADKNKDLNELVMYAENLGEIPPNTALMVVTDGSNRYEVRITSDLQKSGTIRFVHKQKTQ